MPRESFAFRVAGIEPRHDPEWHTADDDVKQAFWQAAVPWVEQAMDRQLAAGLDRHGKALEPIRESTRAKGRWRSHTGMGDPNAPPLTPAYGLSRTRKLFDARAHWREGYILGFWRYDEVTQVHWGKILGYHRAGAGRLPVRDVIGLNAASVAWVRQQGAAWWVNHKAERRAGEQASRFTLEVPAPSGRPIPTRPKPIPLVGRTDLHNAVFGMTGTKERSQRAIDAGYATGFRQLGPRPQSGTALPIPRPGPAGASRPPARIAAEPRPDMLQKPRPKPERPKPTRPIAKPKPEPAKKPASVKAPKATPKPSPKIGDAWTPTNNMQEAVAWAEAHNVRLAPGLGRPVSPPELSRINTELAKMPAAAHQAIQQATRTLELWAGEGISEHPDNANLRGVQPRGWTNGVTWDTVPGAGGFKTYIVANRLDVGHGSYNLVLHEHAHTYDYSVEEIEGMKASSSAEWMAIHDAVEWGLAYEANYPVESFAESFAKYYGSARSRERLDPRVRAYFERRFPT